MSPSFDEQYPELVHYTGAQGLSGILQSQTLWATHYNYLNDAVEVRHFLNARMPGVVQPVIAELVLKFMLQSAANRIQVEQEGGSEKYIAQLIRTIITPMQEHLLDCKPGEEPLAEPHIVSFTAPEDDNIKAHGLLSQWRGYGREGGFAIVFETAKLAELMHEFDRKYENSGDLFSGRVVYSDETDEQILEEFTESEGAIRAGILEYFRTGGNPKNFGQVYSGLVQCACRYKHWGSRKSAKYASLPFRITRRSANWQRKNELPRPKCREVILFDPARQFPTSIY